MSGHLVVSRAIPVDVEQNRQHKIRSDWKITINLNGAISGHPVLPETSQQPLSNHKNDCAYSLRLIVNHQHCYAYCLGLLNTGGGVKSLPPVARRLLKRRFQCGEAPRKAARTRSQNRDFPIRLQKKLYTH